MSKWPSYEVDEIDAVTRVLASGKVNYWTGEECLRFENEFASFADCDYAIAVANGTVALDAALRALGVGVGDEVIVTSRTFIASVSAIINVGAIPIFADVSIDSQNLSAPSFTSVVTSKTKAILCVHLAGWPCDMDQILDIAQKNNIYVVEDCAQAHGARYKGKSVGSLGDVGCWSFCQDKIMTTGGEGGMVTTNRKDVWSKVWSYKDHGKSLDALTRGSANSKFKWVHESFGTNWRMTEMQAAIGRVQLTKMKRWQSLRERNCKQIWATASKFNIFRVPHLKCSGCHEQAEQKCVHAYYKCYIFVNGDVTLRNAILDEIIAKGLFCSSGSCSEVYLEKAFDNTNYRPVNPLPGARLLGDTSLMFQCHPTLTDEDLIRACKVIEIVGRKFEDQMLAEA